MSQRSENLDHVIFKVKSDPIDSYLLELEQTVRNMDRAAIWEATMELFEAWKNGKQVFLVGNGGSAATASHMANDLNKLTITTGKARFKAIALTDNIPLMTAWGNDSAYEDIFSEQLVNFINPGDVIVAISASGNSPNILKAVRIAKEHGATAIALTGDTGGKLKELSDYPVLIPSSHIGQQEDGHMILDHVMANTLKKWIEEA
jgi:D-sedoheptulose 7-phosphate isomerase